MGVIIGVAKMARILNVSRPTIYRYIDNGMPCSRPFDKFIFDLEEVNKWLRGV